MGWIGFLAGSSKTVPRIFIFSIVLGAEYSFYLKSIATYAPAFLGYNNSALARVGIFKSNTRSSPQKPKFLNSVDADDSDSDDGATPSVRNCQTDVAELLNFHSV